MYWWGTLSEAISSLRPRSWSQRNTTLTSTLSPADTYPHLDYSECCKVFQPRKLEKYGASEPHPDFDKWIWDDLMHLATHLPSMLLAKCNGSFSSLGWHIIKRISPKAPKLSSNPSQPWHLPMPYQFWAKSDRLLNSLLLYSYFPQRGDWTQDSFQNRTI